MAGADYGPEGNPGRHLGQYPGSQGVASAGSTLLGEYGTVENIYEVIHEAEQDKKELKELQDFWKNCLGNQPFSPTNP